MACQLGGRLGLVVTDIRMPEMDGTELATHLAGLNPAPRILFVSGFGTVARSALPGPLLPKPFTPQQLVNQVRSHYRGARAGSATSAEHPVIVSE